MTTLGKTLIFIPTYNEVSNVETIARQILALGLDADLMFMDDGSPDGTGEILDRLARENPRLRVVHRAGKLGIGSAHREAILRAYEAGYETLITMDCDFTHPPAYLRDFIAASKDADVVVGSRYLRRDSLDQWNIYRLTLTRVGHLLTRSFLGLPYDATGAYRLYRLDRIERRVFEAVESAGYSFFFESLYLLFRDGRSIKEIPITLPRRTYGTSKMRLHDAADSVLRLVRLWRRARRLGGARPAAGESQAARTSAPEWDEYWHGRDKPLTGSLYDRVASLYRTLVIKRNLDAAIFRSFREGASLLHAGCGSGQVDTDIARRMNVTALDISPAALEHYARANANRGRTVLGSIFSIPLPNESLDGVYNLGVMEHFTEDDIARIFREFVRVLKPGGKVVIFWPQRFGTSVLVLGLAHRVRRLFGVTRKLHPDELTLLRSRAHAERLLASGGLKPIDYSFGPRDFFVQAVIVGEKEPA